MSLTVIAALAFAAAPSPAKTADGPKSEFIELYAVTCLANAFTPDHLRKTLNTSLTPEIPKEQASAFLAGRSGTAWRVFYGKGQYAVSLIGENTCAVFAPKAPIDMVTADFVRFASQAPHSLQVTRLPADQAGPNTEDLTSTAFLWQKPGQTTGILYILTTSKAALDPEIQAMASVTTGSDP